MTGDCVVIVTVTLIVAVDWATVVIKICKECFFIICFLLLSLFFSSFVDDKEQGIDFRFKALRVLHTLNSLLHSCS